MRYSKEHKQQTHDRIVRKASVKLRELGAHGIGVAGLMKDAGLTHGGFYAHFPSRDALVVEAFAYAMDRSNERWRKVAAELPPQARLAALVDGYLSVAHRDDPGRGCAVPALGAEIARESPKTRKAFAAKLEELIDLVAGEFVSASPKAARKQALAALATMIGALVMARIAGTGELSDACLAAGREAALQAASSSSGPVPRPRPARKRAAPRKPRAKSASRN